MRAEALQTIELLSLEDKHGRYVMEIAIEYGDKRTKDLLEIDEDIYRQLFSLDPLSAERARLSLHAGWDPFRQTHYSKLVKISKTLSETHYFTCSRLYVDQIEKLQKKATQGLILPEAEPVEAEQVPAPAAVATMRLDRKRSIMARFLVASMRLFVLTCMLYAGWFEFEDRILPGAADALSDHPQQTVVLKQNESSLTEVHHIEHVVQAHSEESGDSEIAVQNAEPQAEVSEAEAAEQVAPVKSEFIEAIDLEIGTPYYSLPKGYVALTFDDGPSSYTQDIVDVLVEHEVAATFLFVGKHVSRNSDAVTYAHKQGMALGNHSWDHSDLSVLQDEKQADNIGMANEALEPLTGHDVNLFRPPYGAMNDETMNTIESLGMKLLMWNRDPEDWRTSSTEDILNYFKQTEPSGGIYLLHEKKASLEALPAIIDYLKKQDLKFAIFQ